MQKEEILAFLSDIKPALEKEGVAKLGLFGSFAAGRPNEFSDIDVAFQLKDDFLDKEDVWKYFELTQKISTLISQRFHTKSDVFDLGSSSSLKPQIEKEVIYV